MEWLYGRNVVKLVLQAGARRRAHRLAATPAGLRALGGAARGLPLETLASRELDELCGSREHQGVALQVDPFRYSSAVEVLRADVVVVLDEVSDPHNLGAVARSALAAGAGGLVVPKHRSAAVTPAAVKASAGAIERLPVAQVTNTVAFLKQAKDAGFWVYGAAGEARATYLELDLTGRVVLVFGAEGHGLRPLVARTCDALAAVPITPQVESLNVSVRGGAVPLRGAPPDLAATRRGTPTCRARATRTPASRRRGPLRGPGERHSRQGHSRETRAGTPPQGREGIIVNRTVYIVDGYNVLHALFQGASKEEIFARRDWLADHLAGFVALQDAAAVLVFDGHGPQTTCSRPVRGAAVEVCFAGGRFTADTLIARRIAEQPADVQVIVVSADQEVQRAASRAGVSRMTPMELGLELARRRRDRAGS